MRLLRTGISLSNVEVSSVRLRWGLVSFALLSCPFPSHAEAIPAEGQAPAATFKAETRAVDVDIVVLDSHGEPVKGLHREDFAITENGASQTATFFEEHPAETAQANAAANVLLIEYVEYTQRRSGLCPEAGCGLSEENGGGKRVSL